MIRLLTLAAFFFSSVVFAGTGTLMISKTYSTVGSESGVSKYVQCNLIVQGPEQGIQVIRRILDTETTEFSALKFSQIDQVRAWAESARAGTVQSQPGSADSDRLSYQVIDDTTGNGAQVIDLMISGPVESYNSSEAVKYLVQLVDMHCPSLAAMRN